MLVLIACSSTLCHGGMYGNSRVVRLWHFVRSGFPIPDHARCWRGGLKERSLVSGERSLRGIRKRYSVPFPKVLRTFSGPVLNDDIRATLSRVHAFLDAIATHFSTSDDLFKSQPRKLQAKQAKKLVKASSI